MKVFIVILIFTITNLLSDEISNKKFNMKELINELNSTQYTKNRYIVPKKQVMKQKTLAKYDFAKDMWNNVYGEKSEISGDYIQNSMQSISLPILKVDTIFYLFSLGVNTISTNNFFVDAQKLKQDFLYFGAINGFPRKNFGKLLKKTIDKKNMLKKVDFKIKLAPYFYKDLNISEVPAYIFAKCPNKKDGSFKHKNCEYKYLIRGDITLTKALEIVSSKDKYYKQFYRKMIIKD